MTASLFQPDPANTAKTGPTGENLTFLSWNLLHGGGRRIPEIALLLAETQPDLVVLTEFRSTTGGALRAVLCDRGLEHQLAIDAEGTANGLLLAARAPLTRVAQTHTQPNDRVLHASIATWRLGLTAAHLPCDLASDARQDRLARLWSDLITASKESDYDDYTIVGDLNADRTRANGAQTNAPAFRFGQLATLGYVDAFLAAGGDPHDASWHGPRGERARLDHTLLSASLARRLRSAEYLHGALDRRLSDHAPMLVRLAPRATNALAG